MSGPFERVQVRLGGAWAHLRSTGARTTLCGRKVWVVLPTPTGTVDCAECATLAHERLGRLQAEGKA